jgi:hypothetical protein
MEQKAKCRKCGEFFTKTEIIVTTEGFFCSQCLPKDVDKTFFTIHLSWLGINALLDYIDGNATVDQLMVIDKIKDKLDLNIQRAIKEMVTKHEGEVQESDS